MTRHCQLAIIGAGSAGLAALKYAQRHSDDIVLINHGPLGTTCARVGCMPSKALLDPAHALAQVRKQAKAGIHGTENLQADIPAVLAHVRGLRDRFIRGPIKLAQSLGDAFIDGQARFLDPHTLEVNSQSIRAERIIIATGSRPFVPEAWQALGQRVLTTDDFFEQPDLGRRVAVIGLGAIGAELGQGLAHLGLEVHGFSHSERVAGIRDPEINTSVVDILRHDLRVTTGVEVELEAIGEHAVQVLAESERHEFDWVLAAIGRHPNLEHLQLENLGIELNAHGMPAFNPATLQLGDLPIWLAGDVNRLHPILHEAADDGRLAAYHALSETSDCHRRRVPMGIVFIEPNVAWAGQRRHELDAADTVVGTVDFSRQGRALTMARNQGRLNLYFSRSSLRLLGAEMAAPGGEHLAHLLAWAIQQGLTVDDLLQMPFYHPVVEEGLRTAVHDARRQWSHARPLIDLPLCQPAPTWALGAGEDP